MRSAPPKRVKGHNINETSFDRIWLATRAREAPPCLLRRDGVERKLYIFNNFSQLDNFYIVFGPLPHLLSAEMS